MANRHRNKKRRKPARKVRKAKPKARQTCVVYIMRREERTWYARLSFQWEYKIGISTNPEYRRGMIEEDVEGDVRIITTREFQSKRKAHQVEQRLHRIFGDSNFRQRTKGLGQAGATEWFYMTDAEYACAEFWLWRLHRGPTITSWLFLATLVILAIAYLTDKIDLYENQKTPDRDRPEFYQPWDGAQPTEEPTSVLFRHHEHAPI